MNFPPNETPTMPMKENHMTETTTTSLVGSHFRPPAKALLACLPAGHPLFLRPEPTNEYDENAVQVLLRSASLSLLTSDQFFSDELNTQLEGAGFDLPSVLGEPEWHLGYLPRAAKGNAKLEAWNVEVQKAVHEVCLEEDVGNDTASASSTVTCSLTFDASGKPAVIIPWPPQVEE